MWWSKGKSRVTEGAQALASPMIMSLEPRMLFDGAVAATVADAAQADAQPTAEAARTSAADSHAPLGQADATQAAVPGKAVLVIDSRVKDAASLLEGVAPGTQVVQLDGATDGLQQIADYLDAHQGISSMQIIAHGNAGDLWLGNSYLSADNVQARSEVLAHIGQDMNVGGDILIYGCYTAEGDRGLRLVESLAQLTGRDVAASDDRTGLGGDWELEIAVGSIESANVLSANAMSEYEWGLATWTATNNFNTGVGSLRAALASAQSGDIVTFNASMTVALTQVLVVDKNVTIDGDLNNDNVADVTLDGQYRTQIINVTAGTTATLDGLVITRGMVAGNGGNGGDDALVSQGGGIYNAGTLTLRNVTVTANAASGGGGGGGVTPQYAGGGGGGGGAITGGTGGKGGDTLNSTGAIGSAGQGGAGGGFFNIGGRGGSSTGGAGGAAYPGYTTGSAGGTAVSGGLSIGGGGGGDGYNEIGGAGGGAVGGIYNDTGATLRVIGNSVISNNVGAGGGGGGGGAGGGYNHAGGAGGVGVGAIWNKGSILITAANFAALAGNVGGSGIGGTSAGAAGVSPASVSNVYGDGGIIDTNYVPDETPTIGSLDGDSVAWAGVGNTVVLDAGGNAALSDTELGALNGGNGNWSGASLAVQRNGTAVSTDTLGFNTSGALFTVSGGNLQSGGQTFATFTNTGGVLTISFTSSATTATTALVNDIAQRITYRSDTPAGDATLRFTLSDGSASTTADVTVTTDTIYVTNTTDTATVNVSNGVSFSEAVAIAAADVTGSQTLIFSNSFNSSMTLAGALAINESLTINGDSANGLIFSGSTITLGGGTTLNFTNSTGTVTIGSALAGTGGLAKSGDGTLTLGSTSNNGGWSGALSVTGGTLTANTGSRLSTGTITLDNGTLSMTVIGVAGTSTSVANNVVLGAGGGNINIGGGGGANIANFTGEISGGGSLTKTAAAILQLDGNNTYTGATNVSAGTLIANHNNALGTTAGATTVSSGATVRVASGLTIGETFTISGTGKTVSVDYGALHLISGTSSLSGAITLAADANVSAATGSTFTLSGALDGAFNLNKTDAGTLTLTNAGNSGTLFGGISVSAGTLSVASDNHLSSGGLTLAGGSTLAVTGATNIDNAITLTGDATVSNSANASLSGNISGAYNLSKTGASTLTLSGSNSYAATTVSAGTLRVASDGNLGTGAVSLAGGTTLAISGATTIDNAIALAGNATVSTSANATLSGVISGANNLTKAGASTLTLPGSNAYSTTTVSAGTLSVASDANLGSGAVTLASGSTLAVTGATTIDNAIALSGGTATVNASANATLSGNITGAGGLTKAGASKLTLSGTDSYTGATNVNAGTLLVNGALSATSNTTVASAATLGGSGSISSNVTVNSGGTLSPGNGVGALTLNGNLTMASGSTLAVEINGTTASTQYDQVIVNGTVDVSGTTLSATHGYTPGSGDSYTIIVNDAADAVTGNFSGVAEGGSFIAGGNSTPLTASYIGGTGNDFTLTAPINDAPVVGNLSGDSVGHIEGGSATLLDAGSDATVSDSDSADFDGGNVTVSIVSNRVDGEDVLAIRNQGTGVGQIGVSGSNVSYGGVLIGTFAGGRGSSDLVITLNANGTPAAVQALVRNLTYANTNATDPSTSGRTVRVTVHDGDGGTSSNTDIAVSVTGVNDAPTLSATGGTPTYTENGAAVDLFSGVSISTIEAGQTITGLTLTVSNLADGASEIFSVDGTDIPLTNGTSGITTGGNAIDYGVSVVGSTATVTLTKAGGLSSALAQTVVDGMGYRNASEAPDTTSRVVTLTSITDNGGTSNGGVDTTAVSIAATVAVISVNDAPVITAPIFISANEDEATALTGISFADVDAGSATVTATFSVGAGSLNATSAAGVNVTGSGTGTLTLSGSVADINDFIAADALSFQTVSNSTSNAVLTVGIADNGNTGTGGNLNDTDTVMLMVTAVNDAPVNGVPGAQAVDEDAALVFSSGNGNLISISDVDAGGGTVRVTLTASNGLITLPGTTGLSFIVGSGANDGSMTFEGTLANTNAALNGLFFAPTPGYNGAASLQIVTDDLGLSGSGGAQTDSDTIAITVNSLNPEVTSVNVSNPDGGYKIGDIISVTVSFDQAVTVNTASGSPTLLLETGSTDRLATYVSGSGSDTLTFSYTVQAGDLSADLDYQSTGALTLNGATIRSATSHDAILALPALGGADSIAGQHDLVIDGVAPSVNSVSVPANGIYVAGQNLDFTVNFNEAVAVDRSGGTPRIAIALDTGGTAFADYVAGSGGSTLTFRYTVQAGQIDLTGIAVGASLQANGATLRDSLGNDANLTLVGVPTTAGVQIRAPLDGGDPEFRVTPPQPPIIAPPPFPPGSLAPGSLPPPALMPPLVLPPLFEVPTLGSGLPSVGRVFAQDGASAPSFLAQVFSGSGASAGSGSGVGFLGFGGGDGGIFGTSTLGGIFSNEVPQGATTSILGNRQDDHGDVEDELRGIFGAPSLGQQLQELHEREQRQLRELVWALGVLSETEPQATPELQI